MGVQAGTLPSLPYLLGREFYSVVIFLYAIKYARVRNTLTMQDYRAKSQAGPERVTPQVHGGTESSFARLHTLWLHPQNSDHSFQGGISRSTLEFQRPCTQAS